jgi:hypothetical protein
MTIYTGKESANRTITGLKMGVGGVNRDIKEVWTGKSAVNRKVFQSTISFVDDCSSMTGWNNIAMSLSGATLNGSAASNGSVIYPSYDAVGAAGYHGISIVKSLPVAITDFDAVFTWSLSVLETSNMGNLYIALLNNSNQLLYGFNLNDDTFGSYGLDRSFITYGQSTYITTVASGSISWSNFTIRMLRQGGTVKYYDGSTLITEKTAPSQQVSKIFIEFNAYGWEGAQFSGLSVNDISILEL